MKSYLLSATIVLSGLACLASVQAQAGPEPAAAMAASGKAHGVSKGPVVRPRAFGTDSTTDHVLQSFMFDAFSAADSAASDANGFASRFCSGNCFYVAPLFLPTGASIETIELEACDDDDTAELILDFYRVELLETGMANLAMVPTGVTEMPGCDFFLFDLTTPETVDNFNNTYFVQVQITGSTIDTRFQAVRVIYRLQISPAPGVATFTDVPDTHPFFQHVEALAASGITAGCGGGNFCPNDGLTRGQMAVFLAKALGLHWAN